MPHGRCAIIIFQVHNQTVREDTNTNTVYDRNYLNYERAADCAPMETRTPPGAVVFNYVVYAAGTLTRAFICGRHTTQLDCGIQVKIGAANCVVELTVHRAHALATHIHTRQTNPSSRAMHRKRRAYIIKNAHHSHVDIAGMRRKNCTPYSNSFACARVHTNCCAHAEGVLRLQICRQQLNPFRCIAIWLAVFVCASRPMQFHVPWCCAGFWRLPAHCLPVII